MQEYNELTPFEINLIAQTQAEKNKSDQEGDLFLSYINAYWQRVEKLKPFDDIIGKEKAPKIMSEDEMLLKVQELHSAFSGS